VVYVASLIRSVLALHNLINNKVHHPSLPSLPPSWAWLLCWSLRFEQFHENSVIQLTVLKLDTLKLDKSAK
jgi:hypothetical protein